MTDDNMTKSNAALAAAPPKGEGQPLRARGRRVGRSDEAVPRPLTSGQLGKHEPSNAGRRPSQERLRPAYPGQAV